MKRITQLLLIIALVMPFVQRSSAAPCVPGVRDVEYNGRILKDAMLLCIQTEYMTSVDGYLPIGTVIDFQVGDLWVAGRIDGYQWTQYPDQWAGARRPFVYMVSYGTGKEYTSFTPDEMAAWVQ